MVGDARVFLCEKFWELGGGFFWPPLGASIDDDARDTASDAYRFYCIKKDYKRLAWGKMWIILLI